MRIVELKANMDDAMLQCADLLVEAFKDLAPQAWPDLSAARAEVDDALKTGHVNRLIMEKDQVLGWAGARPQYGGKVWEIHPVAVRPDHQGRGLGRLLLQDIESQALANKVLTLWTGSDDETNRTSLSGADLYNNLSGSITSIQNLNRHPYEFYQKCGFKIVGVMPDANGPGKPDIFLAKKVEEPEWD